MIKVKRRGKSVWFPHKGKEVHVRFKKSHQAQNFRNDVSFNKSKNLELINNRDFAYVKKFLQQYEGQVVS